MLPWSLEHRVLAYETYVKNGESVTETQRLFKRRFNIGRHGNQPSRNSILRWVNVLRTTGSLLKAKPPGPVRTARTSENVDRVREAITRSPWRSARRHFTELGISQSTMQRILHKDLVFQPYKIMTVQQLNPGNYQQRLSFCQTMLDMFEENENLTLIMSDEAHFHLNGTVNKQNFRYWASENPRELHQRPPHTPKVTVWCGMGKCGIFGPFFFKEEDTATVTSDRSILMFENYFLLELRRREINTASMRFQQDGATVHTARASMTAVQAAFPNHVISRFRDLPWPPRSPDLSMCDFYLWGFLKTRVYAAKPRTLEELKTAIRENIREIGEETLVKVEANFRNRLQICACENDHHLSDIIFHS